MLFFQTQIQGISFASGVMLAMLALCFMVGQRLRSGWGLDWMAVAMAVASARGLLLWAASPQQPPAACMELLGAGYGAAMAMAIRAHVGLQFQRPVLAYFAGLLLLWGGVIAVRQAGAGPFAYVTVLAALHVGLAVVCNRRLAELSTAMHRWVMVCLLLLSPIAVLAGALMLQLTPNELPAFASLVLSLLGLSLLLATSGRLRSELQQQLRRRREAEATLRALNDSLEQRIHDRTEELEGLVAGLESFNHMVSQDLRGPLGGLSGASELARRALLADDVPRARHLLGLIAAETRRLGELVTQLLVLARVSHAELALQTTPLDSVLAEALRSLALTQGEAKVHCVRTEPLPPARVDPQLMRQVFVNLIGNALKFSGQGATPEVRVLRRPDQLALIIEVRDNEPGFEPEQAQQLFQPFRRLHGARFEGSGIGLTIVKRIIERHGGQVWAEGRPAEGASFFFSLPDLA